jgi:hypothetical protein
VRSSVAIFVADLLHLQKRYEHGLAHAQTTLFPSRE